MQLKMSTDQKIKELLTAVNTIKRLMPEVEAELSQIMGGVGTALEKNKKTEADKEHFLKRFHKTMRR